MKLKKVVSEVKDSFDKRADAEHQFLTTPIVHNLMARGFTFSPFSIGARPDGVWVSHIDFNDDSDCYGNKISVSITGNNLSDVVSRLLDSPIDQVEKALYTGLQKYKEEEGF